MLNLIKAEMFKLRKNKLCYFGIILALFPLVLSFLFTTGSDTFSIFGRYDLLSYVNGNFSTIILGTGVYFVFFSMVINSVVSNEINSDVVIYEIVGKGKKIKLFFSKLITLLMLFSIILFLVFLFTILGYELFLTHTTHIQNSHAFYEPGNFIYSIFYYYGVLIIFTALSFLGLNNGLVIGSFIFNLLSLKLCTINFLAPFLIGGPVYANYDLYHKNYGSFLMSQYVLLVVTVGLFLYFSFQHFNKRDF